MGAMAKYLLETFETPKVVTIVSYSGGKKTRLVFPETINGYPVIAAYHHYTKTPSKNTYTKELVLHKMLIKVGMNYLPNVTDIYMPEEFISGQLPYGMDEWPEKGMTYHIPAASPLAAQLREKLTAAGVTHELLAEGTAGVLDLSGVEAIKADGKIAFE